MQQVANQEIKMKTHLIKNNQGAVTQTWNFSDDKLSPEDWINLPENSSLLISQAAEYAELLKQHPDLKTAIDIPPASQTQIDVFMQWAAYAGAYQAL